MSADRLTVVRPEPAPASAVPPPAARTPEDIGLGKDAVALLALKTLYFQGELGGGDLAKRLGVVFSVIEPALEFLKVERHVEVTGGTVVGGASFRYRITNAGRDVATRSLEQDQYVGPLPVPLVQYQRYMSTLQRRPRPVLSRQEVRDVYSRLVLSDAVLDEIGPAVMSGRSIFIYGPAGNGKTAIATGIQPLLGGEVAVPHAIEVEGHVIRVFDPLSHVPVSAHDDEGLALDAVDRRWVVCRRPMIMVGGELTLDALDLTFDSRLGYQRAPVQLLANGGLLVIDDFGRQRCAPRDLLNRWLVPLEAGVDYLTLRSGLKFHVPFHVFVAFATNLRPSELVDEAFLRRVPYKVYADDPSREDYVRIFDLCCREQDVPFDRADAEALLDGYYRRCGQPLRACHARDLINQALLLATYRGATRRLTNELLETACHDYFVRDTP